VTSVSFGMNPIDLANMLTNAVEISKEGPRIEVPDAILIAYQPSSDGLVGTIYVYGCGRYAAGRMRASLDGLPSSHALSLTITRAHAEELSSALRKTSRAADTRVAVTMADEAVQGTHPETGAATWGNLIVGYKEKVLSHLHDSDVHGRYDAIWARIDELTSSAGDPVTGVALMVGVLSRLNKTKGVGEIADLRTTPMAGVIAAKLGADFVALLGEVNRTSYVNGGRWGSGPGRAEELWPQAG
jgi:hypothetical protein